MAIRHGAHAIWSYDVDDSVDLHKKYAQQNDLHGCLRGNLRVNQRDHLHHHVLSVSLYELYQCVLAARMGLHVHRHPRLVIEKPRVRETK